jgi:hypothetical protein
VTQQATDDRRPIKVTGAIICPHCGVKSEYEVMAVPSATFAYDGPNKKDVCAFGLPTYSIRNVLLECPPYLPSELVPDVDYKLGCGRKFVFSIFWDMPHAYVERLFQEHDREIRLVEDDRVDTK